MSESPLKIVYLSPGAGGMYCGSCLNDNMLARKMMDLGHDVLLLPLYTPTLTDEQNVSSHRVFFGGINVYLQEKIPLFRHLPRMLDRVLDSPWLIRMLASRAGGTDVKQLGPLTLSMVRGEHGHQRKEIDRLVDWLVKHEKPDVINLSNLLIAGCVPALKRKLGIPILLTLQGDDVFLDALPEPYREQVMAELRTLATQVDGVLVHSQFYADAMSDYFDIPRERFHVVPLGISLDGFSAQEKKSGKTSHQPPTVGYLARICEAKGLHVLVDAMLRLREMPGMETVQLRVAGTLTEADRKYFETQQTRLDTSGAADMMHYLGEVTRAEKIDFLHSIDVLSVPTVYLEPKGRYVLEALACGVPVVQPDHGAFSELLADTGGGRLVEPDNPEQLAAALHELLTNEAARQDFGSRGLQAVHERHSDTQAAKATIEVFQHYTSSLPEPGESSK